MPLRVRNLWRAAGTLLAAVPAGSHIASAQIPTPPSVRFTGGAQQPLDFEFTRDTTIAHNGRASIRIFADDEPTSFANVSANLPAQPYAGHRIQFSVFLRSASMEGQGGQLWARADDANRHSVAFINSGATTSFRGTTDWTQLTVSLDIPVGAVQLYVGALALGAGTLWVDDVHLEADAGPAPVDIGFENPAEFFTRPAVTRVALVKEAPRALTTRGLANVTAFTSALGYVRFFHPSTESVRVNWDVFAIHGMRAVEAAPTSDSLASALRTMFATIAPTVIFARTGAPMPATIAKPADATHVVFWRHYGVGSPTGGAAAMNPQSVYHSERVILPLDQVGQLLAMPPAYGPRLVAGPHVPDPSHPLSVALDGGVTMSVPIALYTSETTVLPSLSTARPTPAAERNTANDRATRLADVALAWSLFDNFYPYFDVVHTDWPAARTAALRAAATDPDAAAFQRTLERLIAALHDGHGNVFRQAGAIGSPDLQLGWAEGRVLVTMVRDSAAANGVRRGDELLAVDGMKVESVLAERSARVSGATPQWVRTRALGALLSGEIRSPVQLRLRGADGAERDVRVTRLPPMQFTDAQIEKIAEVSPGVMYVDLGRITDSNFTAALPQLEKARSIIFDMRGYPRTVNTVGIFSHLTDTVIHSARFMTPIITMPNFRDVGYFDGAWTISPAPPRLTARIVFLSGGGAISYAESTLGVVEAYRLGDIVGEASAGTNGNVNPFVLPGGYNVAWTGMLVQKRDGTPHHGVGIVPTVRVSPTVAGMRAGRDEVLERAIGLVTQKVIP
jgi:C-terminal processing protease CtpA/Prc